MSETPQTKMQIRKALIDKIKVELDELRDRKLVADRLGMTVNNLNNHLLPTGRYKNNIEKLGEIAEMVAIVKKEKLAVAQQTLEKVNRLLS